MENFVKEAEEWLETEREKARRWLSERRDKLVEVEGALSARARLLDRREADLDAQMAALADEGAALEDGRAALVALEASLRRREQQLLDRERAVAVREEAVRLRGRELAVSKGGATRPVQLEQPLRAPKSNEPLPVRSSRARDESAARVAAWSPLRTPRPPADRGSYTLDDTHIDPLESSSWQRWSPIPKTP